LGQCLRSHGTPNDAHETATADGDSAGGDGAAKADGDSAGGDGAAKVADEGKEGLEELTTWWEKWKRTHSSGRLDTGAAPSQELQEIQGPVDGSQPSFQEQCFQWWNEEKCEWANCDAAWNRTMVEQAQAGEVMFPLYRRGGTDVYEINLESLTQTNKNNRRGGRVRPLRLVGVDIIKDETPRPDKEPCLGTNWQVEGNQGWTNMPPGVNEACMKAMPTSGTHWFKNESDAMVNDDNWCDVEHKWSNPRGKHKTTTYQFDFDAMTQTNPDSGTERRIRLVRWEVLRTHGLSR
jgi:hypothetical protein